jgi:hypothetical protein
MKKNILKHFFDKIPDFQKIAWVVKNPKRFFLKYKSFRAWKIYLDTYVFQSREIQDRFRFSASDRETICTKLVPYIPSEFPHINKNSNKKSLLVETRILPHTEFVIKNTIQKLGDGWGHMIFCSTENHQQIQEICKEISSDIEIIVLEKEIQTKNDYNNLMLSLDFWNQVKCEKVLVYQTDTFIFKDFDDDFLQWDFIGAPIENPLCFSPIFTGIDFIGNGGFSLRSVSIITHILITEQLLPNTSWYPSTFLPEDMFFCYHIAKQKRFLPTPDIALSFSYEYPIAHDDFHTIVAESFGSHTPEKSIDSRALSTRIQQSFSLSNLLHVYVITWNNAEKLEYFINYYRTRFKDCNIAVYDNNSTDNTKDITLKYNCEYICFYTDGLDDVKNQEIKNTCWKNQKEIWAFCLDDDELLDITLTDLLIDDSDVIPFIGVERFNRRKHMRNTMYNKSVAFRVQNIIETNFTLGAHVMHPIGKSSLVFSRKTYFLIHDKYSDDTVQTRVHQLRDRILAENHAKGWSWHYDTNIQNYYEYGIRHGVEYNNMQNAPLISYKKFRKRR